MWAGEARRPQARPPAITPGARPDGGERDGPAKPTGGCTVTSAVHVQFEDNEAKYQSSWCLVSIKGESRFMNENPVFLLNLHPLTAAARVPSYCGSCSEKAGPGLTRPAGLSSPCPLAVAGRP